jgi:hypothetical protein
MELFLKTVVATFSYEVIFIALSMLHHPSFTYEQIRKSERLGFVFGVLWFIILWLVLGVTATGLGLLLAGVIVTCIPTATIRRWYETLFLNK